MFHGFLHTEISTARDKLVFIHKIYDNKTDTVR